MEHKYSEAKVDAVFELMCHCDAMSVVKMHWYGENVGRRYRVCPQSLCAYHRWIDPPLGPRAVEAIAELQGRIVETDGRHMRRLDRMVERHEAEMRSLKTKQGFMVVSMFMVFAVMMGRALSSVAPDDVDQGYDNDDLV